MAKKAKTSQQIDLLFLAGKLKCKGGLARREIEAGECHIACIFNTNHQEGRHGDCFSTCPVCHQEMIESVKGLWCMACGEKGR